jgi:hypothetical protein
MIAAALVMSTLAGSAQARESGPGNGGDGILVNGKIYSLDLVEAGVGVAENPYFDPQVPSVSDPEYALFFERVQKTIGHLQDAPVELLSRKLYEISRVDRLFSRIILKTLEAYLWVMVSEPLRDIQDEDTNLELSSDRWFQLAIRRDVSILLQQDLWQRLDPAHRVALILHEVLYANLPVESRVERVELESGKIKEIEYYVQVSRKARVVVGYLFTPQFRARGIDGLRQVARDHLLSHTWFSDFVEDGNVFRYDHKMTISASVRQYQVKLRGWGRGEVSDSIRFSEDYRESSGPALSGDWIPQAIEKACASKAESDRKYRYVLEPNHLEVVRTWNEITGGFYHYRGRDGEIREAFRFQKNHFQELSAKDSAYFSQGHSQKDGPSCQQQARELVVRVRAF